MLQKNYGATVQPVGTYFWSALVLQVQVPESPARDQVIVFVFSG